MNNINTAQHFVPSPDVVTTIVIPTIIFCIGMVVAMLIGINKCKQWELDKIVEMRRTRRVIQRITARLREKNFRTIQKARNLRKRAVAAKNSLNGIDNTNNSNKVNVIVNNKLDNVMPIKKKQQIILPNDNIRFPPPPFYGSSATYLSGNSPPPTYEDSLLDQLYFECLTQQHEEQRHDSKCSNSTRQKSIVSTSSKTCRK